MEDSIKQVVKDVKYLIATDCNDETIQARIENFIKERDEALSIANVVGQSEQLLEEQSNWLMANTSLEVEKIVDFKEHFK